ncbi:MAG: hypothetical protein ABI216_08070 [Devosia sp.]
MAPLDVLDATFGPDFDLVGNHREVNRQLYCPACGESRPTVLLEKPATGEQGAEPARWYG